MKNKSLIVKIFLALLSFLLILYVTISDEKSSTILTSPDGKSKVTVFDIYNQEYKRKELIITPVEFEYDGLNLPGDYVKILFEGGFIFNVKIVWDRHMVYVHNCGGTSDGNNLKLESYSRGVIDIVQCEQNDCCLPKGVGIKISQNCSYFICD